MDTCEHQADIRLQCKMTSSLQDILMKESTSKITEKPLGLLYIPNKVLDNMPVSPTLKLDLVTFTTKFPSIDSIRVVTDVTQCRALGTEKELGNRKKKLDFNKELSKEDPFRIKKDLDAIEKTLELRYHSRRF